MSWWSGFKSFALRPATPFGYIPPAAYLVHHLYTGEAVNTEQVMQMNCDLTNKVRELEEQLSSCKQSEQVMAKRVQALNDKWPAIHKRFFTVAGEEDRAGHRKTTTNRKPKKGM